MSSSSSYTYAAAYLNVSNWKKNLKTSLFDINALWKEEEEMAASPSMIVRGKGGRKIGFLGLGTMGEGMASVLLDAFAMNRDDTKDAVGVESNGIESGNPEGERGVGRDVAEKMAKSGCEIVYAMLADPTASKMVAEQFAEGLREQKQKEGVFEHHHHQRRRRRVRGNVHDRRGDVGND